MRQQVTVVTPKPIWMIFYCCALQWFWGISLVFAGGSKIAAWDLFGELPDRILGFVFIFVAILAFWGLLSKNCFSWLLMIPQQVILAVCAMSAIRLSIEGHYADWVYRPSLFILRDQVWAILLAFFHLFSIGIIYMSEKKTKRLYDEISKTS